MATQTLEFSAGTGLTLSCKLFALGSDTVVDTQTATEKTNDLNRYSVAFTDVPAGAYRLNAFVGAVGGFANEVYDLTLTTATFSPRSESAGLDAAGIRTAVGLASANLDTQLSTIDTVVDNIETDTQDIQSRLPAELIGGFMQSYVAGASNSGADTISSRIATNIVAGSYDWPSAVGVIQTGLSTFDSTTDLVSLTTTSVNAIGDAFLSHVITKGDPGTIERAFWQVTKAAASFDGTVQTSVSNTASSFLTDIAIDDFAGQVLVLVDGALAGEARAITSVVSGVVTVHDAFTGVPADGVNFLVLPQQVYSISQIQNGLATSAGVTSAFTEIKGATWSSSTDTLEAIRDASGGSSSITITAGAANAPARSDDTNLIAFVDETISQALAIYEADGTTAKDMSGKTLAVVFENLETTDTAVVASGDITVSGVDNNTVTWAYPAAVTSTVGKYRYALRDAAAPKTVYAQGLLFVKVAAAVD